MAIVGCVGDTPTRFDINPSTGNVTCATSIPNGSGIHLYVSYCIA